MGQELATFLTWYIEAENIPAKSEGTGSDGSGNRTTGGISVLAWSMGNLVPLALLAHLETLVEKQRDVLEKYLRSYIMFGKQLSPLKSMISAHHTVALL